MPREKKVRRRERYPKHRDVKIYKRWMPYEAALLTIRTVEGLTSRTKYWDWHNEVRPYYIPKYPHRVYEEWTSWNDFLGNDNTWDGWDRKNGMEWMEYWEAVRLVQKMGIKSKKEYIECHKGGMIPENIPRAPDQTYKEKWTGWPSFLGKGIVEKVESADSVIGILALCSSLLMPSNVIEIIIAPEGKGQLQDKLDVRKELKVIKMYQWEKELWSEVRKIMGLFGTEQESNVYMCSNVNAMLYELDCILLMYR